MLPSKGGEQQWGGEPSPKGLWAIGGDLTEAKEEREDQDCSFLITAADLKVCSPWAQSDFGNS